MTTIEPLAWDTDFFGFRVARLIGPLGDATVLTELLTEACTTGIRLLYAPCAAVDRVAIDQCTAHGGRLVDVKRTYSLTIREAPPALVNAEQAPDDPCSRRQLRALAWQAAVHSRYRVDPRMPPGAWRRLYSAWMAKSLSGELADAVLVERQGREIKGMITISCRGDRGSIGLFAVGEANRGRGVGKRLLRAAQAHCAGNGCLHLDVVTQGANRAACEAYRAFGFELRDEVALFHFWMDPP